MFYWALAPDFLFIYLGSVSTQATQCSHLTASPLRGTKADLKHHHQPNAETCPVICLFSLKLNSGFLKF